MLGKTDIFLMSLRYENTLRWVANDHRCRLVFGAPLHGSQTVFETTTQEGWLPGAGAYLCPYAVMGLDGTIQGYRLSVIRFRFDKSDPTEWLRELDQEVRTLEKALATDPSRRHDDNNLGKHRGPAKG